MSDEITRQANELSARPAAAATDTLVQLDPPIFLDVAQAMSTTAKANVVQAAARALRETSRSAGELEKLVWLIRELDLDPNEDRAEALRSVLVDPSAPDSLRCIAMDALEHLYLRDSSLADAFRRCVESVPMPLPPETRRRWIRILAESHEDWGVRILRNHYETQRTQDMLDALASAGADDAARKALDEMLATATSHAERATIQASLTKRTARSAKEILIIQRAKLDARQAEALVQEQEFAILCKGIDDGLVAREHIAPLVSESVPSGLSRSQRRFWRELRAKLTAHHDDDETPER